jgi:hypothetical protein
MPRRQRTNRAPVFAALLAGLLGLAPEDSIRVGQKAPYVVALLPDGNFVMQANWHGKVVLLTFWSRKDASSLRQFELLKKIRKEFAKDERFWIVSVCTDEDWDAWLRFLESQGKVDYGDARGRFDFYMDHKWFNAFHDDANFNSAKAYGVKRLPEAFLIGPDGRVLAARVADERLRDTVAAALRRSR